MRTGSEVAIFVTRHGRREVLIAHRSAANGTFWHTIAAGSRTARRRSRLPRASWRKRPG